MAAIRTVAHRLRLRKSRVPEILAANPQLSIKPRHGVITLFGYGIQVRVDRGHLILEDGIGADRRYARLPTHWQLFQSRSSPLSGRSARLAANPPNAILNYLYAVLESEVRLAAAALGLDPAVGFLHADSAHRDSLVFDLMEPVRPQVDAFVLDWFLREPVKREWFFEQRDGNCRLMAELASRLSETAQTWHRVVAPIAEFVTRSLWATQRNSDRHRGPATHLTQQHRRAANDAALVRKHKTIAKPQSLCRICGVPVAPGRSYCAACGVTYSTENIVRAGAAGRKKSHAPEAQARRAEAARKNSIAQWRWDPSTQPAWLTQEFYVNRIHPLLAKTPVTAIVSATGLRRSSAAEILRGRRIPHPRHWVKLAELVGVLA